jgi:hypothetical protein
MMRRTQCPDRVIAEIRFMISLSELKYEGSCSEENSNGLISEISG